MLSNGAFVLTSYEPAATAFELVKNADYYDADRIALDGLNYQVIKDSQQALMSYQNGDLDITLLNGEQVEQVKDDPEFTSVGAGYLWYISPNMDAVPELANLNLRRAITFALDRDSITNDVLKDGSSPAYTAVPAQFATGPDGSDFSADQTKFCRVLRQGSCLCASWHGVYVEEAIQGSRQTISKKWKRAVMACGQANMPTSSNMKTKRIKK